MTNKHIAMCGLDCTKCSAFIATKNSDNQLRRKTANDWTERYKRKGYKRPKLKPIDINCKGCLSDGPIFLYCEQCGIRQCGLEKGIKNCRQCADYKCKPLKEKQSHFWHD